ncbi:hypothetical protein [Micromonospora sp. WMMC250]|uniref:hypothetical protein n=1 Tax=Micromonospora sp. WMMC250 TaxID=3014781 RepID=UPI0022B637CD|nr:hypothetical protein [Micromonospora sp. WMMC250]MCZ7375291.1 hypothetical protein [Micromonospora sp. WMMC250]
MQTCRLVAAVACLALLVVSGCGPERPTTAAGTPTTYTCCDGEDVDTVYQPGQEMTVHWIVKPGSDPAAKPTEVELTARLTGPYGDVSELKSAAGGTTAPASEEVTFEARPVRPSGAAGERPASVIPIAEDAPPGFYNLIFALHEGGGGVSGASVVLVAPKT